MRVSELINLCKNDLNTKYLQLVERLESSLNHSQQQYIQSN